MTRDELLAIAREPQVAAFLRVIRACEGTAAENGYAVTFGYEPIADLSDHPRRKVTRSGYTSTAAGAFQFIESTWDEMAAKYGLPDFSPESQDAAAVGLLIRANALDVIRAGRLEEAIARTNRTWASLPGSPYGQPTRDLGFVRRVFAMYGGREPGASAPIEARTQPPVDTTPARQDAPQRPAEGKPMSPFIIPALNALVPLLPTLSKLFKGEEPSRVAERNADAVQAIAERVLPLIVQAVGAPNVQAAVEQVQQLPELARRADDALRMSYAELHEMSERSLAKAREFVASYGTQRDVRTVVGRFTFPEFLSLVFIALASLGVGYLMVSRQLGGELLGGVVTLMLIGGWTEIRKFWFGLGAPDGERPNREP
jgi:muramidase (phage lysozyme)